MIISKTPLRMSFAGGGSDIKDYYKTGYGAVVSTTINKYVYVTANRRFTDKIRVAYSKIEEVDNIDDIKHNLVRESLKMVGGLTKGLDITYSSDMLPAHEGSGLGSSSSLIVGTLNALYALKKEYVSAKTLAEQACRIEIDILGHPIGKQDQYAAAFGGFNYIQFNKDESVYINPIMMSDNTKRKLENNILLYHTGINTISKETLVEEKAKMNDNIDYINDMVKLAETTKKNLNENNLDGFGELLHIGWEYKKKLASNMSNKLIDKYYDMAIKSGAKGGRILGSGGGGFLLFYCDNGKNNVRDKMSKELREMKFKFEPEGSKIIYVD